MSALGDKPLRECTPEDWENWRLECWERRRIEHRENRRAARERARAQGAELASITPDELPANMPDKFLTVHDGFVRSITPPPKETKRPSLAGFYEKARGALTR
jgi:hypothetical protein